MQLAGEKEGTIFKRLTLWRSPWSNASRLPAGTLNVRPSARTRMRPRSVWMEIRPAV